MMSQANVAVDSHAQDTTLSDLLARRAAEHSSRTAIIYEDRDTSFAQLDAAASRVASALLEESLQPGARVCYLARNDNRFLELLFGCARASVVLTPINWRLTGPEIAFILKDAQAELVFVTRDYLDVVRSAAGDSPLRDNVILLDDEAGEDLTRPGYLRWLEGPAASGRVRLSGLDDVALQIYTSGTTARPKGAQLTNRNLTAAAAYASSGELGPWSADDVLLMPLPLFHGGGIVCSLYAIYLGAKLVLTRDTDLRRIVSAFNSYPITKVGLVPALIGMMLDAPECDEADFSHLTLVLWGGSPMTQDVMRRSLERFDCPFTQLFGMSEATISVSALRYSRDDIGARRLESAGKVLAGAQVRIVDGQGRELPLGEIGEVVVKSRTVMHGYWRLPAESAEVLSDGWYSSGDMGHLDEDGHLYLHDRARDMIISGGENVYPIEVENALVVHPDVAEVAVIGVPDPKWGEAVKAVVVLRPDANSDPSALIEFTRQRIAAYKCPRSVDFVDALPRNALGKILKKELRRPYWGEGRQVN